MLLANGSRFSCRPRQPSATSPELPCQTLSDFGKAPPVSCSLLGRSARWRRCTNVHTLASVAQWDAEKAAANLRKHGVDFADAETALHDEVALTQPDDDPEGERFVTLGTDALGRLLVVVYEWRDEDVRLISARKATRAERRQYEDKR